jgi:hypothetical protein
MRLTEDYIHAFRGPSGVRSACRIRLYVPDEEDEDLGPPTWKPLDRQAVEILVACPA